MTWEVVDPNDGDRACPHDSYVRRGEGAEFRLALLWNGQNLSPEWCPEHGVWIEVPRVERLHHGNIRQRERSRGVTVVEVESDLCGVCFDPLNPGASWPSDAATTKGHEPPLSRTVPGDTVLVRPEHWGCNRRKGTMTDAEMLS